MLERFTSPAVVFGGLSRLLIALFAVLSPCPLIWELPTSTSRVAAAIRALIIIPIFTTKAKEIRHGNMTFSFVGLVVLPGLFLGELIDLPPVLTKLLTT